jgi:hypothetical protein
METPLLKTLEPCHTFIIGYVSVSLRGSVKDAWRGLIRHLDRAEGISRAALATLTGYFGAWSIGNNLSIQLELYYTHKEA